MPPELGYLPMQIFNLDVKDNYVWGLEAGLLPKIYNLSELSFVVSGTEVNTEGTQTPIGIKPQ